MRETEDERNFEMEPEFVTNELPDNPADNPEVAINHGD